MSNDYVIGVPHKALKLGSRIEFTRECGFALLDIGELIKAKCCFEKAQLELIESDRSKEIIDIELDISMTECTLGDLKNARHAIDRARAELEKLHSKSSEENTRQYSEVRSLYRRLIGREAHLCFLEGNYESTLDLIGQIEDEKSWQQYKKGGDLYPRGILVPSFTGRLEAEQVHLKIAALNRCIQAVDGGEQTPEFSKALNISMEAMLYAQTEGFHHQAMGFRIALARCFRRMNRFDTSETILDSVHRDLLRYGCSERTFLSFLNEAGHVLGGLGDHIRAYATYLRPCIGRAKARGFRREASKAAAVALRSLAAIRQSFDKCQTQPTTSQIEWTEVLKAALIKHQKLVIDAEDIFRGGALEKDPLFAYAIVDAEAVILELDSGEKIDWHIQQFNTLLLELRDV